METAVTKIRKALKNYPVNAIMLTSPQNRFYATGFDSSAGIVLITPKTAVFATDFRYFEDAKQKIHGFRVEKVGQRRTYLNVISDIIKYENITRLGFEDRSMTYSEYLAKKNAIDADLVPMGDFMDKLRMVKTPFELSCIEKAQRIAEESFEEILPFIRVGVTEQEICARLVYEMAKRGSQRVSFDPIVVSGKNGSLCHGKPTDKKVESGEFVTLDFGATYNGYCSDMTRTVAVGKPSDEMINVYETVLTAQIEAINNARAGILGSDLDAVARKIITDRGYGEYFGHSLGHGLGIDVHDAGGASASYQNPLPEGFVCTIEPGIYIPGKFGVRIEDFVVLTKDGCINITKTDKKLLVL